MRTGNPLVVIASAPTSVAARVEFRGAVYPLVARGEAFWGVLAIPVDAEAADEPLRVTFHDAEGNEIGDATSSYQVVETPRDVEEIIVSAETSSLLTGDASQREAALRAEQFAQSDLEPAWTEAFRKPVSEGTVTAPFGSARSYNGGPVTSYHSGADYGGDTGSPVVASAPGRVSWTGEMPLRGNSVIIDHGAGVKSGYHHLSRIDVAVDDVLAAGDQIGALGATGLSTGPHLHWEISIYGVNVDPLPWLFNSFQAGGNLGPPTAPAQE